MNGSTVTLVGNATREPELRYTPAGQAVANFGVAVNRFWRDAQGERQEAVGFFDIQVWGDLAENAVGTVRKGMRLVIVGRLDWRSWEDATTKAKRSKIEVVAEEVAPSLRFATASVLRTQRAAPVSVAVTVDPEEDDGEEPFTPLPAPPLLNGVLGGRK